MNGTSKGHQPRETPHGEDSGNLGSYDKEEVGKDRPKGTLDQLLDQSRQVRLYLPSVVECALASRGMTSFAGI